MGSLWIPWLRRATLSLLLLGVVLAGGMSARARIGQWYVNQGSIVLVRSLLSDNPATAAEAVAWFRSAETFLGSGIATHWLAFSLFKSQNYVAALEASRRFWDNVPVHFHRPLATDSWEEQALRGWRWAGDGQATAALQNLRSAWTAVPGQWDRELFRRYYQVLAQQDDAGDKAVAHQVLQMLQQAPGWSSFGIAFPMEPVTSELRSGVGVRNPDTGTCWALEAIKYDQPALERGPLVPVQLFWLRGDEKRFKQDWLAVNLAPNAGFEWEIAGAVEMPLGWPSDMYGAPDSAHMLAREWRNDAQSQVAALKNSKLNRKSSLIGPFIAVQAEETYLQVGSMRSADGLGYIGRQWLGPRHRSDPLGYDYVAGTVSEPTWRAYAGLARAPAEAHYAEPWLLNYDAEGEVFFDDILFAHLPISPCENYASAEP